MKANHNSHKAARGSKDKDKRVIDTGTGTGTTGKSLSVGQRVCSNQRQISKSKNLSNQVCSKLDLKTNTRRDTGHTAQGSDQDMEFEKLSKCRHNSPVISPKANEGSVNHMHIKSAQYTYVAAHLQMGKQADSHKVNTISSTSAACHRLPKRRRLIDHLKQDNGQRSSSFVAGDPSSADCVEEKPLDDSDVMMSEGGSPSQSNTHSNNSQEEMVQDTKNRYSNPSSPRPVPQLSGPRITYARQRSYLAEDDTVEEAFYTHSIEQDSPKPKTRLLTNKRSSSRHQNDSVFDDISDVAKIEGGRMRNIHELRKAGSDVRSASEMEAILDDIDNGSSLSLTFKCSRLLELVIRLEDVTQSRLFIDSGFNTRLPKYNERSANAVFNALLTILILYLLRPSITVSYSSRQNFDENLRFLGGFLDDEQDLMQVTKDRSSQFSASVQKDLEKFGNALLKSPVWKPWAPSTLTTRVICLKAFEYVAQSVGTSPGSSSDLDRFLMSSILRQLKSHVSCSIQHTKLSVDYNLRLTISILELLTTYNMMIHKADLFTEETIDILTQLLPALDTWPGETVTAFRTSLLRLYLNITNNNITICQGFAKPSVMQAMLTLVVSHFKCLFLLKSQHKPEEKLDTLILSLGSLINLVEFSDTACALIKDLQSEKGYFLETLLDLFQIEQAKACRVR